MTQQPARSSAPRDAFIVAALTVLALALRALQESPAHPAPKPHAVNKSPFPLT
jgi:hypothetical protein